MKVRVLIHRACGIKIGTCTPPVKKRAGSLHGSNRVVYYSDSKGPEDGCVKSPERLREFAGKSGGRTCHFNIGGLTRAWGGGRGAGRAVKTQPDEMIRRICSGGSRVQDSEIERNYRKPEAKETLAVTSGARQY